MTPTTISRSVERMATDLTHRFGVPFDLTISVVRTEAATVGLRAPMWLWRRVVRHAAVKRLLELRQLAEVEHDYPPAAIRSTDRGSDPPSG